MNRENEFVEVALASARDVIGPPLSIKRGKALLYRVTVNNRLKVTVEPHAPKRGQSAFETDLCVFETVGSEPVKIPRVVMEFKQGLSTHDVLTYSAKATRHKQVYPYLRYGLVIGKEGSLPTTAAWTSPWPRPHLATAASISCSLSYWRKKWLLRGG